MADLLPSASGAPDEDGVMQHSPRAIADALGVGLATVQRDIDELTHVGKLKPAEKMLGQDGKAYPAKRGPRNRGGTLYPPPLIVAVCGILWLLSG